MIQKLKKKFILINMSLVFLVLLAVFGVLLISTYGQLQGQGHMILQVVLERGFQQEALGLEDTGEFPPPQDPPAITDSLREEGAPLIPTFLVWLDQEGEIVKLQENDFSSAQELSSEAVRAALENPRQTGVLAEQQLRFLKKETPEGMLIAFADRSNESYAMKRFLINSFCVGLGALAAFALISLFLSSWALKPVQAAWQRQKQFVADASHELRTPLTVILANMGILQEHKEETLAAQEKWVNNTVEEAKRMKKLVDDLLFLAKADASKTVSPKEEICFSDLTLQCVLSFEPVAFEQGIDLKTDIQPELTLWGCRGELQQLLMILLDNGGKYAGPDPSEPGKGPWIRVSLHKRQNRICLQVENSGECIPQEALPHLFERFYRVDSARTRTTGGSGLGLAIAKTIADEHQAQLAVTSKKHTGTCFSVCFPC